MNGQSRLTYVESLMRKNYNALGFIPRTAIDRHDQLGQLWLQYENDEPCGYLIFGSGWPVCKVWQCCIQIDARRQQSASQLMQSLITKCEDAGYSAISLRCADDLESNSFWSAFGFHFVKQSQGGMSRGRKINHWVFDLENSKQLRFFPAVQAPAR